VVKLGKKKPERIKHVPQRTCVGCRKVTSKRALVRLVKSENGIVIDPTGKMPGRGVYLHAARECWINGLKGSIVKGLKTELNEIDRRLILDFVNTLPEDDQIFQNDSEGKTES